MSKPMVKRSEEREFAFKMLYAGEFNSDPWRMQVERLGEESKRMKGANLT